MDSKRVSSTRIRFSLVIEFLNAKRWTLCPTINGVKANHHRRNENRGRNNRGTVANCRLHQLTHRLPLTVVSSGLLNANIEDANVHVVDEENFSFPLDWNRIIKIIQTLWNERKRDREWERKWLITNKEERILDRANPLRVWKASLADLSEMGRKHRTACLKEERDEGGCGRNTYNAVTWVGRANGRS